MNIKRNNSQVIKVLKRPVMWLFCMILCVALLASFCLGWYVASVVNADNKIQASVFEMEAKIQAADGAQVQLTKGTDGEMTANLSAGQTYTVSLSCSDKTNGHGGCTVVFNGKSYQTVVFGKCAVETCTSCAGRQTVQFTITVPAGDAAQIKLIPYWGQQALAEGAQEIGPDAAIPNAQ